jgi:hypothetical protein
MSESIVIQELEARIADLESRVERASSRLEKFRADLDALRRAREIVGAESGSGSPANSTHGKVIKATRKILPSLEGEFGSQEVHDALAAKWPDHAWDKTSIATALRRLQADGVLEQTVEPAGRRPGQFRVASQNSGRGDASAVE